MSRIKDHRDRCNDSIWMKPSCSWEKEKKRTLRNCWQLFSLKFNQRKISCYRLYRSTLFSTLFRDRWSLCLWTWQPVWQRVAEGGKCGGKNAHSFYNTNRELNTLITGLFFVRLRYARCGLVQTRPAFKHEILPAAKVQFTKILSCPYVTEITRFGGELIVTSTGDLRRWVVADNQFLPSLHMDFDLVNGRWG